MILENVEFEWVMISTPAKKYGSNDTEWKANVLVSKAVSTQYLADKLITKHRPHESKKDMYIIPFTLDTHKKDLSENDKPRVFDKYGKELEGSVGNGSKGSVRFRTWDWEFNGATGTKMYLQDLLVTDLVEYEGGGDVDEFDFEVRDEVDLNLDDDIFE